MRRLLLIALVLAPVASAAPSPDVQQRIVPGQSIGKVAIGMTLEQVKRALGKPEGVIEREQLGFGRAYTELSWNLTEWRIGFVVEQGRYRVVRIGSSVRGERTREGVGVGSRGKAVERTYRVRCLQAYRRITGWGAGYWCVVGNTNAARTAFVVHFLCTVPKVYGNCPTGKLRDQVTEVYVFARGERLPVELQSRYPLP